MRKCDCTTRAWIELTRGCGIDKLNKRIGELLKWSGLLKKLTELEIYYNKLGYPYQKKQRKHGK